MTEEQQMHLLFVFFNLVRLAGILLSFDLILEGIGNARGVKLPQRKDRFQVYLGIWTLASYVLL